MTTDTYVAIERLSDSLSVLQQEFIQNAGELLHELESDISASSYYLEELGVYNSDITELKAMVGGGHILPPLMTPKRKFMVAVKSAMVNAKGDNASFRKAVRNIGSSAKYKFNRESVQ